MDRRDFLYGGVMATLVGRVLGDVTVSTPLGNFTRPYDQTGRFSTLSGSAL